MNKMEMKIILKGCVGEKVTVKLYANKDCCDEIITNDMSNELFTRTDEEYYTKKIDKGLMRITSWSYEPLTKVVIIDMEEI